VIALSTAWDPKGRLDKTLAAGRKLGFETFELSGPQGPVDAEAAAEVLDRLGVRMVSVHAVASGGDVPEGARWGHWAGDVDESHRREGVRFAKETLDVARRVGAGAIIMHGGLIPMPDAMAFQGAILQCLDEGTEFVRLRERLDEFTEQRRELAGPSLDALAASLAELCEYAPDVNVALETPYWMTSIPHGDEFEQMFDRVAAPNLRYWHDVGHTYLLDRIGFIDAAAQLDRYRDRLAGVHLHDIRGMHDHQPPGTGEFDFGSLVNALGPDVLRVIEVHSEQSPKAVKRGRERLAEMYGID